MLFGEAVWLILSKTAGSCPPRKTHLAPDQRLSFFTPSPVPLPYVNFTIMVWTTVEHAPYTSLVSALKARTLARMHDMQFLTSNPLNSDVTLAGQVL